MRDSDMAKEVSIIMPCFNVEMWIDRCLTSITEQTYPIDKLEIICVDDCSTDSTLAILHEWEARYPESIIVVECEMNGRQGMARNIGLQYASAEWIAFIDSDDWVEKDYISAMLSVAEDCFDVICCKYDRDFSKELSYYSNDEAHGARNEKQVQCSSIIINTDSDRKSIIINPELKYSAWAKLIRKSFLMGNELFFPTNITYEDAVWGSLLHLYFNKAKIVDKKLYHYFVNEKSTVLMQNSFHHFDSITSQTILWNLYEERGFMDVYREELEIEHIFSAYLPVIKAAVYRYAPPNYNMYLLIRTIMLSRIGNYRENSYVKSGYMREMHMLLMAALDNELSRAEFNELASNIKRIGI